jgi:hypothetical protein
MWTIVKGDNMNVSDMMKYNPYTFKKVKNGLFTRVYEIMFEDTVVRNVEMSSFDVKDIVFLLNAAYHLGYSSGYVCGEMENKNG